MAKLNLDVETEETTHKPKKKAPKEAPVAPVQQGATEIPADVQALMGIGFSENEARKMLGLVAVERKQSQRDMILAMWNDGKTVSEIAEAHPVFSTMTKSDLQAFTPAKRKPKGESSGERKPRMTKEVVEAKCAEVLESLKAGPKGLSALGGPDVRAVINKLFADGKIVKEGERRNMVYKLA